jgi:hypothetical protein
MFARLRAAVKADRIVLVEMLLVVIVTALATAIVMPMV